MGKTQNCLSSGAFGVLGAGSSVYTGKCLLMGLGLRVGSVTSSSTTGQVTLYDNSTNTTAGVGKVLARIAIGWSSVNNGFISDQILFPYPVVVDSGIWCAVSGVGSALIYYAPIVTG